MFSHNFGDDKSKIEVLTGPAPFKGSRDKSTIPASSSFWWLLAVLGIPWFVALYA